MDAQKFWDVIGKYNQDTYIVQILFLALVATAIIVLCISKFTFFTKTVLGTANLFISTVFFGIYGTEPIQKYFALPIYITNGLLFLYDAWRNKNEKFNRFNVIQIVLLLLYCLYPLISYMLGNEFPQMVTHIMPCPIVSLSIAIYASFPRKNLLLLSLLTVWGLTGVKSVIFSAYEDIILLICGIYGVYLIAHEISVRKKNKVLSS